MTDDQITARAGPARRPARADHPARYPRSHPLRHPDRAARRPDRPPRPRPGRDDPGGYQPDPAPAWWQLSPDDRQEPVARLRAWVDQVYRPGYGHLAAALGPCWPAHDLCLYALDIASGLWSVLYLQPGRDPVAAVRPGRIPGPHPARPGRPAGRPKPPAAATPAPGARHDRRSHPPPGPGLRPPRLAGVPLPARPEDPRHPHGFRDATTDPEQITGWFARHPD